jgi:predicted O-methyltransferase YrrM
VVDSTDQRGFAPVRGTARGARAVGRSSMTSRQVRRILSWAIALPAALIVKAFVLVRPDSDARIAFARKFRPRIGVNQIDREIKRLCVILARHRPRTVLEIGTAGGGTLFLFSAVAADDATLISVDLPPPAGYPRDRWLLYRAFGRLRQRVLLLRSDSHDPSTLRLVTKQLRNRPLDFLFIDGDHSAAGVARDYEMYGPLVRPGGIIAIHDVVPGAVEKVGGVPSFWRKLKSTTSAEVEEIVDDWSQGGFGIGVVRVAK